MAIAEYDLSGTVAFVTGAGRGIGTGIAQVLAEAGADVVINRHDRPDTVPGRRSLAVIAARP
jgi:NAD(P)-dependent dehydrogenase (short-subunit alcohol dehydrogenase family)